ncbi:Hypothetical predicted protein [Mytilus galloprovincialis]|uniref:Uncharacterized protein n=1 Tax=Mytilus galloprovincialis TaxID=29158 RepID=A0A8B6HNJ3_MYTGA|nr:Hypothetical predicted protein [Mytilus galloprovincialis]
MTKDSYPRAAETVLKSTYMDDSMDSVINDEQGIELYNQLSQLWAKAGMYARKWLSNSKAVFTMHTRRRSRVTRFIAPYTIRGKLLLQEMWTAGLDWDDQLDEELVEKSREWFRELDELCSTLLRRLMDQLFMLLDTRAYKSGMISTRLLAAKSRVAPLTSVSIPRLELMAAVLGLRLALSVKHALEVPDDNMTFWSDSMNVLYWIRGRSREYKPFVANRIGEIHTSSHPQQWRHVPTKVNPADLVSRGRTVEQLQSDVIWWNGPEFLQDEEPQWPDT